VGAVYHNWQSPSREFLNSCPPAEQDGRFCRGGEML
jgi:hypothetical protein